MTAQYWPERARRASRRAAAQVTPGTLGPGYFDAMYEAAPDPWGFEDRWYERRKYAVSLALLPHQRYRSAFEPGCSIGVLTAMLAPRCDRLLSCDVAAGAVQAAVRRTRDLPQVLIEQRHIPRQWPAGRFDLIVFSEILYYFGDSDLEQVLDHAVSALRPGGTLLAVHWRHPVPEYPRSGDDVHLVLAARPGLARLAGHDEEDFLAETYSRTDGQPVSVARATGLV
jgi:SAM-dependent methyltransferase